MQATGLMSQVTSNMAKASQLRRKAVTPWLCVAAFRVAAMKERSNEHEAAHASLSLLLASVDHQQDCSLQVCFASHDITVTFIYLSSVSGSLGGVKNLQMTTSLKSSFLNVSHYSGSLGTAFFLTEQQPPHMLLSVRRRCFACG